MPVLPNMTLITPTLGADSGTWDDKINAALALVDAHDHTAGKGVLVPVSGLNINADLPMGGFFISALGKVSFTAIAAPSTGSKALFVSSSDNELYWRTNAGTNVKLTNGASINTTLVGGIVGDYSTVGAALAFVDADKVYTHKTQTATWARLASGPVRIYEYNTTESVYVEHAVAAGLAAPYTVTWAAALPASTSFLKMDTSGNISTFADSITDQIPACAAWSPGLPTTDNSAGSAGSAFNNLGHRWSILSANPVLYPIIIRAGATITGISLKVTKGSAAVTNIVMELVESDGWGAYAAVAAFTVTNSAAAPGDVTLSSTGTQVATAGKQYAIRGYQTGTTSFGGGDRLGVATVTHN